MCWIKGDPFWGSKFMFVWGGTLAAVEILTPRGWTIWKLAFVGLTFLKFGLCKRLGFVGAKWELLFRNYFFALFCGLNPMIGCGMCPGERVYWWVPRLL